MSNIPTKVSRAVLGVTTGILAHAGGLGILAWSSAVALFTGKVARRDVTAQMFSVGVQSIPLVIVMAALSGIVTSQQGGYQLTSTIPLYILGSVVTSGIVLELAPVMTAVGLIGRVGARITAELGTMKVSEQIDALYSLGRDPVAVLAAPRILAGTIMTPLLVLLADGIGTSAGIMAAWLTSNLGPDSFMYGARLYWHTWDMFYGVVKGTTFGFIIPLISVHMGLLTTGGAEGVGRSTTAAVVFMIIAVFVSDAMFPPLLLN
jgi:phospholipid/cholesterol/gamma-HCH transport system permease protein